MTDSPVRFAILGFGHHAVRRLMPAFARSQSSVVIGAWRRDGAALAENCRQFGIEHAFASREELCASPLVDAVLITSPDAMHRDDTLLAFANGKAVLCEKPVAMNALEAVEMAQAAASSGLLFGVAQNFRWNRTLEWMRDKVAAGAIGDPLLAHAQYAYPAQSAPRKWITDPTLACGGPIADVGVHCVDALRFVLGRDAMTVNTLARQDEASGEVEAVASLQLEMTGGVFATVTASARSPYRTLLEITGSEGALVAENGLTVDRPVDIVLRRAGVVEEQVTLENNDGYTRMIDSFASALRSGTPFAATGADGVHNMLTIDAAFRSWRSGQREAVAG